ncbi:MAG: hypothetical protein ABJG78_19775 [Cyclobacteriaceae bacterium]
MTYDEALTFYDQLVALNPNFERLGKTMPYTAANTHMFSLLNKAGELGIRLSKESGNQFMAEHDTTPFKSHGAFLRGYVLIPEKLYADVDYLSSVLSEGYEYVMSLKPQPRKK